jgi:hypothetical protein
VLDFILLRKSTRADRADSGHDQKGVVGVEEQPYSDPSEEETLPEPWPTRVGSRMGRVLFFSLVGALGYALVIGPRTLVGVSNGLFVVGALLLVIGLMPLLGEIFGRATVTFGSKDPSFEDVLEEERRHGKSGGAMAFAFDVSGIILIVLSLIVGFVAR